MQAKKVEQQKQLQAAKEAHDRSNQASAQRQVERDPIENGHAIESAQPIVHNQIDFDQDQFDRQCRDIIVNIKGRFIDLAPPMIDDEQQDYYDQIQKKQDKFRTEFEAKLIKHGYSFDFKKPRMHHIKEDDAANFDLEHLNSIDGILGKNLSEIQIGIA